jgi:hypothetical protein
MQFNTIYIGSTYMGLTEIEVDPSVQQTITNIDSDAELYIKIKMEAFNVAVDTSSQTVNTTGQLPVSNFFDDESLFKIVDSQGTKVNYSAVSVSIEGSPGNVYKKFDFTINDLEPAEIYRLILEDNLPSETDTHTYHYNT